MTTMELYIPFSSYYLFYANDKELFTNFTIQLMEERMKVIEQNNDKYRTFCKNILNVSYGKLGMNKSKYSKLVIMDQKKAFFSQCLPEFKGSRAIRN
jgi:hypothetical protein